jgi:hypothetical protein
LTTLKTNNSSCVNGLNGSAQWYVQTSNNAIHPGKMMQIITFTTDKKAMPMMIISLSI